MYRRARITSWSFSLAAALLVLLVSSRAADNYAIAKDDRTMGSTEAPVVMIEYAAPTCPHCARFAADVLPKIKKDYIDKGKVLYVFRIFPLSSVDGAIAGMAKCMPPKRYFEFIDLAFKKQEIWDPDGYNIPDVRAGLLQLGKLAGLKKDVAERCMADQQEIDRVNRISEEAYEKYDVRGTPTFVINGTVVSAGESTWPALKARFDGLLAKSRKIP